MFDSVLMVQEKLNKRGWTSTKKSALFFYPPKKLYRTAIIFLGKGTYLLAKKYLCFLKKVRTFHQKSTDFFFNRNNVFWSFLYSIVYKSAFSPPKTVFLSNPKTLSDSNIKNTPLRYSCTERESTIWKRLVSSFYLPKSLSEPSTYSNLPFAVTLYCIECEFLR